MRPICAENSQATVSRRLPRLVAERAANAARDDRRAGNLRWNSKAATLLRCPLLQTNGPSLGRFRKLCKKQRCRLNVEATGVSHVRSCKGIDAQDTVRCEYEFQIAKPRSCGASHSDYPVRQ